MNQRQFLLLTSIMLILASITILKQQKLITTLKKIIH